MLNQFCKVEKSNTVFIKVNLLIKMFQINVRNVIIQNNIFRV